MRYHSLRIIVSMYHFMGITVAIGVVVFFFIFAIGAIQLLQQMFPGVPLGLENYAAVLAPPFLFLVLGAIFAISLYAAGTLLVVVMDIEENTRSIDYKMGVNTPERSRSMNGMWDEQELDPRRAQFQRR